MGYVSLPEGNQILSVGRKLLLDHHKDQPLCLVDWTLRITQGLSILEKRRHSTWKDVLNWLPTRKTSAKNNMSKSK